MVVHQHSKPLLSIALAGVLHCVDVLVKHLMPTPKPLGVTCQNADAYIKVRCFFLLYKDSFGKSFSLKCKLPIEWHEVNNRCLFPGVPSDWARKAHKRMFPRSLPLSLLDPMAMQNIQVEVG